ncbi:Alcohol dehydrogenase [Carbonactinospora thermoautotrophica]|uniref:Alcohol dehydrogenase n=2 Tax=Carbonactinospora thermoautotrophica TaxID=1469144 RepID=A0A132MM88_9ACTN|nr:maleylacetate reductase [Carbonactinospora thermoautotrophica]KWW98845.1 Alcohol dehydrogenase [Carbonactinospora thermoautotrophica]
MRAFVHELVSGRVVFGAGALTEVPDEVARLGGRRVLVIHGEHEKRLVDRLTEELGDRVAARIGEVTQHVPVEQARAAVARADEAEADLLLTIGGGSAVGLAKAVARERGLPILAVPTTYAGSEMTPVWGLTEAGRKTTGRDPRVLPRTVVYDPELTVSLPPDLTAASGMNALAHCVEALYAPDLSPVLALVAVEAMLALADALPRCVAEPADLTARGEALYGAWLAGMCAGNATMGLHHKLAHVLGGTYGLPHAPTHAVLLPYTMAYNRVAVPEVIQRIGDMLGADDAVGAVWQLARSIGAPASLRAVGLRESAIDEVASTVARTDVVNPRQVTYEGVRELLAAAYAGQPPA